MSGPAEHPDAPPPEQVKMIEEPPRATAAAPLGLWAQVERTWLGVVAPPFAQRAAEASWRPSRLWEYCHRCGHDLPLAFQKPGEPTPEPGCLRCASRRTPWSNLLRIGVYEDLLQEAIVQVKFERWPALGVTLGRLLGGELAAALHASGVAPRELVLVPMPTSLRRRLARGIDHTAAITRGVRQVTGGSVRRLLSRSHRPSQLHVQPSRRARNVRGAFRGTRADLAGKTVVLIDDVLTTGATMRSASRALLRAARGPSRPAALWAAVLAVADS